jgi:hypothetical protein
MITNNNHFLLSFFLVIFASFIYAFIGLPLCLFFGFFGATLSSLLFAFSLPLPALITLACLFGLIFAFSYAFVFVYTFWLCIVASFCLFLIRTLDLFALTGCFF